MQANLSFPLWLEAMRHIAPISGLLHVGAGIGQAVANYAEWRIPAVVLVEAREEQLDSLKRVAAKYSGWSAHQAVLGSRDEGISFHVANNPAESGILVPESLANLWRNLKTKEQRQVRSTPVHAFLETLDAKASDINWVVIDCLPALPILEGAKGHLDHWDVLVVRTILDQAKLPGKGASKAEVDSYLQTYGFHPIATEEERQPAAGAVLYARNWKSVLNGKLASAHEALNQCDRIASERQDRIEQLIKAQEEQSGLAIERQSQIEQLVKARDEQARLVTERQSQIEQLTKVRDELEKLATERQSQIEQLIKARDEQAGLAAERKSKVDQIAVTRDEQSKLAADRQLENDQLRKSQESLEHQIVRLKADIENRQKNETALKKELLEARQTASLSIRLQTLREADLKELQDRYRASLAAQENQHQLLVKLSERLSAASRYFHQLAMNEKPAVAPKEPAKKLKRTPGKRLQQPEKAATKPRKKDE